MSAITLEEMNYRQKRIKPTQSPPTQLEPTVSLPALQDPALQEDGRQAEPSHFPQEFLLNESPTYDLHQPFNKPNSYDVREILVNMDLYVSESDHFMIKLRDIFKN